MTDIHTPQTSNEEDDILYQIGELLFQNESLDYVSHVKTWFHAWVGSELSDSYEDREQHVTTYKALEQFLESLSNIDREEFLDHHFKTIQEETDATIMRMDNIGRA